jgi:bis(5'-nucleosyl)-tetraphosphatase (symmetrical)
MSRRIFIGDIQGCREELEALLEKVGYDPAGDELHPVGDWVNRGPDSLGTLRLLHGLGAQGVLGNHDIHALAALQGRGRNDPKDTLEGLLADEDGADLVRWLARRPFLRSWPDLLCVHAAIHPKWTDPVETLANKNPWAPDNDVQFATRTRYCDPSGQLPVKDWPTPMSPFQPWDTFWRQRKNEKRTVVFGHWARRGLVQEERTRGLDTGCVWGNQLTAWIAEEDRFVQVPARKIYSAFD